KVGKDMSKMTLIINSIIRHKYGSDKKYCLKS
ncbi:MAG: hypothetical protein ACI9YH_004647, partial [Colwellia sp.]